MASDLPELFDAVTKNDLKELNRVLPGLATDFPPNVRYNNLHWHSKTDGKTLLHHAVKAGHAQVADLLIEYCSDIEAVDSANGTPLHEAAAAGHKECVVLLLDKGAQIAAMDKKGLLPLHRAVQSKHRDVAGVLLNRGANVDAADNDGNTSLHIAAGIGNRGMAAMLLDKGARPGPANNDGQTPLHIAAGKGHKEVVGLLIDRGAAVEVLDYDDLTPLACAAKGGHKEVAELLLDKGARRPKADVLSDEAVKLLDEIGSLSLGGGPATEAGATVFVSFRVNEADKEARALKKKLEEKGVTTFVSSVDIKTGENWRRTIAHNLKTCKLVVILGTKSYGGQGTSSQGTLEEVITAKEYGKKMIVVQMCDKYDEIEAAMELKGLQGARWNLGTALPDALWNAMLKELRDAGVNV